MMAAGRPRGSKNKFPNHSKIRDELLEHKFDWMAEFAKLFGEAPFDIKRDMLLGIAPYLFPKRKPEDGVGDASEAPLLQVSVTDEQLQRLVTAARGE